VLEKDTIGETGKRKGATKETGERGTLGGGGMTKSEQIKGTTTGNDLEPSRKKFLRDFTIWYARKTRSVKRKRQLGPTPYSDLEEKTPEGFHQDAKRLERTDHWAGVKQGVFRISLPGGGR